MWQWLVVAPLVLASAGYAAWAVAPAASRLRFARWLARRPGGRMRTLSGRLERAALPRGSCESCPGSRVAPPRAGKPPRR